MTTDIYLVSEYGRSPLCSSTDRTLTVLRTHNRFYVALGGTTVLPWNRGTSFPWYQYRRGHGTTMVPEYRNTTNTAVLPYGTLANK